MDALHEAESRIASGGIPPFRRRRFLIHTPLQIRLLALTMTYAVVLAVVVSAVLFTPLIVTLLYNDPASTESISAASATLYLHSQLWIPILACLAAMGWHSIRTSHRIAGPLYRLTRAFETLRRGGFPEPIRLRTADFLRDEIEGANETFALLQQKIGKIRAASESLQATLDQLRTEDGATAAGGSSALIDELCAQGKRLDNELSFFESRVQE